MPDSRKTAEKGAEGGCGKTAEKQKNSRNTRKTAVLTVFRVFRLFFQLFFGCLTGTHSAPFLAVFRLCSMSGIYCKHRQPCSQTPKHTIVFKYVLMVVQFGNPLFWGGFSFT